MRTHVIFPDDLAQGIDALVGRGKGPSSSKKLYKEKGLAALKAAFGTISAEDHPEWATPESTYVWSCQIREEADAPLEEKFKSLGNVCA